MKRKSEREMSDPAAKILKTLEDQGKGPEALDDAVHSAKSAEASDINNNGLEAQIEYLLSTGMDADQIIKQADE